MRKLIMRGLLFLVPIWLTITVIGFIYHLSEAWLGPLTDYLVRLVLPDSWLTGWLADGHVPGLSLLTLLALLAFIGFVAARPFGARGLRLIDLVFLAIPGVRSLYATVRKIIDAIGDPSQSRFQKVVFINWAGVKTLGFQTNTVVFEGSNRKMAFVFVPHMPNPTSGFLVLVAEEDVIDTGMTTEEGIKIGMSLGVLSPPSLPISSQ